MADHTHHNPSCSSCVPQFCGAMHSHLPLLILAMNGLAGSPVLPMMGQLAMQGWLVNVVGSVMSQQSTTPHAYLTAVGTAPFSGLRSTTIDDGVGPASIGRLIQPMLYSDALLVRSPPFPPNDGNRPDGAGCVALVPTPPDQAGQYTSLLLSSSSTCTVSKQKLLGSVCTYSWLPPCRRGGPWP